MPQEIELLEIEDWKQRAERSTVADDLADVAPIKSRLIQVKAVANEERVLEFVISDGGVDRERDTINPKGWDLKAFKQNPVVLWAHESWTPPLGRAVAVWREDAEGGSQLVSRAEFCDADTNPMGDFAYRMLKGGFLRATSVGFKPKQWAWVGDDAPEERRGGIDFAKQELLEYSIVPIPANPRALMRGTKGLPMGMDIVGAHTAGIDTSPLRIWCEKKLDRAEPLKGLAPSDVEAAWKASSPRKLTFDMGAVAKGWPAESKFFEPAEILHIGAQGNLVLDPPAYVIDDAKGEVIFENGTRVKIPVIQRSGITQGVAFQRSGDAWLVFKDGVAIARAPHPDSVRIGADGLVELVDPGTPKSAEGLPAGNVADPAVVKVAEADVLEDFVIELEPKAEADPVVVDLSDILGR